MANCPAQRSSLTPLRVSRRRAVALAASAMAAAATTPARTAAQDASATPAAAPAPPALSLPSTLAADASPEFRAVVEVVVAAMQELQVPGAALGILAGDREEHVTLGLASRASLTPVGPDTRFQIGSLSKTFTATAIWHLFDAEVLSLDAPVRTYLPEFRLADEATAAEVTVGNLLDHTGGWLGDLLPGDPGGDDAIAQFINEVMPTLPQLFPLGEFFSYNNTGFIVLGHLIELATGATYDAAIRDIVLGPLGLDTTLVDHDDVRRQPYADGHYFGPINGQDVLAVLTPLWVPRALDPTGGIWSTTRDLIRYARFHLDPGTVAGTSRIVQPDSLRRMQTPAKEIPGLPASIGMNWVIQEVDGVRTFQHPGLTLGQATEFIVIPEHRFAFAMLTNSAAGRLAAVAALDAALANYPGMSSLSGKVGIIQAESADPSAPTVTLAPDQLAEYAGRYATPLQALDFAATESGLTVTQVSFPLPDQWQPDIPPPEESSDPPAEAVTFIAPDVAQTFGFRLPFVRDASGRVGWVGMGLRLQPRQDPG